MRYVYLYETRGIQRFLFATGKLKDMLEGSELIDYICADNGLVDKTLKSLDLTDKIEYPRKASGAFYLIFNNIQDVHSFQRIWRILMSQWLPSLEQVEVISQAKSAKDAVNSGISELAKQRNQVEAQLPSASPIAERSPRTGQAVVQRNPYGQSGIESLDASTSILRSFTRPNDSQSLTSRFLGEISNEEKDDKKIIYFPNNFESDAKASQRFPLGKRSLVGLVHADGNGLGEILRLLNKACRDASDEVYIDLYRTFSEGMTKATIDATNQATQQVLLPETNDKNVLPARPLVLGGDDLSVIIKADLAIEFTTTFLKAFKKTSKRELDNLRAKFSENGLEQFAKEMPYYLTACAGIVFMNSSQPFHQAYDVAEGLCKQAKIYSRQFKQTFENSDIAIIPSSLAFYKINDSLIEETDMMVENSMTVSTPQGIYRSSLPAYMIDEIALDNDDVGSEGKVATLDQLYQLNDIVSHPNLNARPLRELMTLINLNIDQASQLYLRWLQYSRRFGKQLQSASQSEQREIRQINKFLNKLEQTIGRLQSDLPFTKLKNNENGQVQYQSIIGDLITLMTIAEEKNNKCKGLLGENDEGVT